MLRVPVNLSSKLHPNDRSTDVIHKETWAAVYSPFDMFFSIRSPIFWPFTLERHRIFEMCTTSLDRIVSNFFCCSSLSIHLIFTLSLYVCVYGGWLLPFAAQMRRNTCTWQRSKDRIWVQSLHYVHIQLIMLWCCMVAYYSRKLL